MSASSDQSPLADPGRLLDSITDLSQRFALLAEQLTTSAVEPLRRGLPPNLSALEECRVVATEYLALADRAATLGIPTAAGLDLQKLAAAIRERLAADEWDRVRSAGRQRLDSISRLSHTLGANPPYLLALHRQAARLRAEFDGDGVSSDPSVWATRLRPFEDLWQLLTDPESLPESEAEAAVGRVEESFGRAVVSAVMTRKLATNPVPSSELVVDTPSQPVLSFVLPDGPPRLEQLLAGGPGLATEPVALQPATIEPATRPREGEVDTAPRQVEHVGNKPQNLPVDEPVPAPSLLEALPPPVNTRTQYVVLQNAESDASVVPPVITGTPAPDADQKPPVAESAPPVDLPDGLDGLYVRTAIWRLVGADRVGLAYHIAAAWVGLGRGEPIEPPALFRAAALAPFVRSSFGEVVEEYRSCVADLSPPAGPSDESALANWLVLFGLSLRPTLLAPATGATSLLQSVVGLDSTCPAIGRLRQAVVDFGEANLGLNPSVLKGGRDHAEWAARLRQLCGEARRWLESNRQAKIIYAAATNVWHQWLREEGPLGHPLRAVIDDRRSDKQLVREALKDWSDNRTLEKKLARTDETIRGNGARRRPIEARSRTELCDRVAEFVRLAGNWLDHIAAEPRTLDDYRQRRADQVREEVQNALPEALGEVERLEGFGGMSVTLPAALQYTRRALQDLRRLFDPSEEADSPPIRVILGEELLAVPRLELTEDWRPMRPADGGLLRELIDLVECPYSAEESFRGRSEERNHVRTAQVVEAVRIRGNHALAERLQEEREEAVRLCRGAFQQTLANTRAGIERAVCYDLISSDDRNRFSEIVEGYSATVEDLLDFARAWDDLRSIDEQIAARHASRVLQVSEKLNRLTAEGVPADRQGDIEVIRIALARGDFLSAEEYVELVRCRQPLASQAEPVRQVLREFFAGLDGKPSQGFTQRFNDFMEGKDARSRPQHRDLIEKIRYAETVGPIDMAGVPKPQAKEAAATVEAWLQLKSGKGGHRSGTQSPSERLRV